MKIKSKKDCKYKIYYYVPTGAHGSLHNTYYTDNFSDISRGYIEFVNNENGKKVLLMGNIVVEEQ